MTEKTLNLRLPGNDRRQPKSLQPYFGYDMTAKYYVRVEDAVLATLAEKGVIPGVSYAELTQEIRELLLAITTTEMDAVERSVTNHDIRALIRIAQELLPESLRQWLHAILTSYDIIDTGRALMFYEAHRDVVRPKMVLTLRLLRDIIMRQANNIQTGRTHSQYAVPITFGYWVATCASRILENFLATEEAVKKIAGKISGPVGARNAQKWVGKAFGVNLRNIDIRVGEKLGVPMAPVTTQLAPLEPLADYLYACLKLSASIAQFADDCRKLMGSEIAEVAEEFEQGQSGSSTMAGKRNPVSFEQVAGIYEKGSIPEFMKVLLCLNSEHQRDLKGSGTMRDFPIIVVNLVYQLDILLRPGKKNPIPFLERIHFADGVARKRAIEARSVSLAEPAYILLQTAGKYPGDAHELLNHTIVPLLLNKEVATMQEAIEKIGAKDGVLMDAWMRLAPDIRDLFGPLTEADFTGGELPLKAYTGYASEIALDVANNIVLALRKY